MRAHKVQKGALKGDPKKYDDKEFELIVLSTIIAAKKED